MTHQAVPPAHTPHPLKYMSNELTVFDRKIMRHANVPCGYKEYSIWVVDIGTKLGQFLLPSEILAANAKFIYAIHDFYRQNTKQQVETIVGLKLRTMIGSTMVVNFTDPTRCVYAMEFLKTTESFGFMAFVIVQDKIKQVTLEQLKEISAQKANTNDSASANANTTETKQSTDYAILILKVKNGSFDKQKIQIDRRNPSTMTSEHIFIAQLYELSFLYASLSLGLPNVTLRNIKNLADYLVNVIKIPKNKITDTMKEYLYVDLTDVVSVTSIVS